MRSEYKVLITGATGSIGSVTAIRLAEIGADIALHYHKDEKRAKELAARIEPMGRKAVIVKADFKKTGKIVHMVKEAAENLSGLNVLVHCAASFMKTPFEEVTEEIFDDMINVNLKASFFLAQAAKRFMKDGGRMIFFSDVAAQKPYSGYLPYCMSKGGIDTMVKGLAKKFAPAICVNAIAPYLVTRPPGLSDSGWNDMISRTPARRESPPSEIAEVVAFLMKASPSLTGQIVAVDGGRLLR
jgi:NAD(P)-dependent dehydrogenase (short-subunit alcohol dehydrogenase family)